MILFVLALTARAAAAAGPSAHVDLSTPEGARLVEAFKADVASGKSVEAPVRAFWAEMVSRAALSVGRPAHTAAEDARASAERRAVRKRFEVTFKRHFDTISSTRVERQPSAFSSSIFEQNRLRYDRKNNTSGAS